MQYMLLIYGAEAGMNAAPPDDVAAIVGAYQVYTRALTDAGVIVSADRLQSVANATTVRTVAGAVQIQDGPFAETKEQLGGYYIIETPDLDAALAWARQCPAVHHGSVEVRPVFTPPTA